MSLVLEKPTMLNNNIVDNPPRPEGEGLGVRATQYISRETILRVVETLEPYIQHLNLMALVEEAAEFDHNVSDWREVLEQINVAKGKRGAFALLTLVAEDLLNGKIALANGTAGEVKDSPRPEGEGSGGEGITTLHFTYVERGESKGSSSPKWEFRTASGERYWAFHHKDPKRNTLPIFTSAGYSALLDMKLNDCLRWNKHPITVQAVKNAENFWEVQTIISKPADARPDTTLLDCITSAKKRAALKDIAELAAGTEYDGKQIVIIDSETTGTTEKDELVEFAGFNLATGEVFETLISTFDNTRINALTHLHGITEEMLNTAPSFDEVATKIEEFLRGKIIVAHGREFDLRLLRQTWEQHEREFPVDWKDVEPELDTMLLMAQAVGDPGKYGDAQWISLAEAAALCKIETRQTHRAFADVRLTHEVIKAAAAVYEQVKNIEFIPADMDDIPF
jgi:DNA polymerase III epsilon subunit-like protein